MSFNKQITFKIDAKDNATSKLRAISNEAKKINTAYQGVTKSVTSFSSRFSTELSLISSAVKFATVGIIGLTGATAAIGYQAIKTAGNLEQERMAFKTLLGSIEEADKAIEMIKKDAASTPFELPGLIQANKLLTAVTKDAGRSEDILLNVGKALSAMGKGQEELDRIIVNLQQIGAVGKASMLDIKQFAFAGIPIFEMLTETTGKTGDALQDMISNGEVSFEMLEEMFKNAGQEGGRFANAFTDQAGTFNQLVSNMKDNFTVLTAEIAQQSGVFDIVKNSLKGVVEWTDKNKESIIAFVRDAVNKVIERVKAWIEQMGGPEGIKQKLIEMWETLRDKVIPAILEFIGVVKNIIGFILDHRKGILNLIIAYEAIKLMMYAGGVIKAVIAFGSAISGVTTLISGSAGLSAALAALPLMVTIGVALVGFALIMEQISGINKALDNIDESSDQLEKTRKGLMDKLKDAEGDDKEKIKDQLKSVADAQKEIGEMQADIADGLSIGGIMKNLFGGDSKSGGGSFALGGDVNAGQSIMVGEHGPERFIPSQSGTIMPNKDLSSGQTFNFTFNGDVTDKNQLISQIKQAINRELELSRYGLS